MFVTEVVLAAHPRSLIPVLVTGIQPDQVLGLKELSPRRRRGAAPIPVTSRGMKEERLQSSEKCYSARLRRGFIR
ncbi:hypothetical protein CEJ86_26015 [Sinorhizobium meliloti]|uniref:Uncharacterized protein n=1 Tax=Rhizobium meliloti TaxID=382 RepID=A0A2J0YWC3_RHIML|nr:hypothetical protein CEJ86_26015 [Sinorhizobium meliloti]